MSKFQTKEFKALQTKWYDKLKKKGFDDIEDTQSTKEFIKEWHSVYFQKRHTPMSFYAKQEYYYLAQTFLNEHPFQTKQEKRIWILHSEGLSIRKIAIELNTKIWKVHRAVRFLSQLMLKTK